MSINIDKFFQLSHLYAVDVSITVYHEGEMCKDAKNMNTEAVQAERDRVRTEEIQRRNTREEKTDVPPVVDLDEFIEIFNDDVQAGMIRPMDSTNADSKQGYIHIGNPPDYYVSLKDSKQWHIVDLAEVIKRHMDSLVKNSHNPILQGLDSNRIQVDKVQHIVINGINAIYYNAKPERQYLSAIPSDVWEKIDLKIDYKRLQDEHAALEKKVAAQEQTILELRGTLDVLRAAEKSRHSPEEKERSMLSPEEKELMPKGKGNTSE